MSAIDWVVLCGTLLTLGLYGIIKGRGSGTMQGYFLGGRSMRWFTVGLSIMATQASAITFTSTPGQAYVDGMRFIQFYLGLPIAMVILSATAVPIFHRLRVFTAYEYLESRFDAKTRILTSAIFLLQRGLAVGITIYAPSLILSVMLGLDVRITSVCIGSLILAYTVSGGVKAVNHTHVYQLLIVLTGMSLAFVVAVRSLPTEVSFGDALHLAGGMGRLNVLDFSFDLKNRYNFWSGVIGGGFVALAYFGTDQSQVQRYLTGRSVEQSRLALMFNGIAKVPMQFLILLLGAMVFVFYQFSHPPLFFNPVESARVESGIHGSEFRDLERRSDALFREKQGTLREYLGARRTGSRSESEELKEKILAFHDEESRIHARAAEIVEQDHPGADANDTNYIFLSFVLHSLPRGFIGLLFACIFTATMSSSSGELSALASTSVVDIYRRFLRPEKSEKHYVVVSRLMMAGWGVYAVLFAQYASRLGSLIEAVNILGSLFYGTMLGIFLLAFYVRRVDGTSTFIGALAGEGAVLLCFKYSSISWLWYNVVGCAVVVSVATVLSLRNGNAGAASESTE